MYVHNKTIHFQHKNNECIQYIFPVLTGSKFNDFTFLFSKNEVGQSVDSGIVDVTDDDIELK